MEDKKQDYTKLNIYQKMLLATDKIEKVKKKMTVGEGKNAYKAVREVDVLEAVKDVEVELGIYSYPFDRKILNESREIFKNSYGEKDNFVMRIETVYRFINIDLPTEFIDVKTYGDGIDSQDKAPGKAMTYADKYALLKAYKIETGNDPDKDPSGVIVRQKSGEVSPTDFEEPNSKEAFLQQAETDGTMIQQKQIDGIEFDIHQGLAKKEDILKQYDVSSLNELTYIQAVQITGVLNKRRLANAKAKKEVF